MPAFETNRLHRSDTIRHLQADRLVQVFDLHLSGSSPALATAFRDHGIVPAACIVTALLAVADRNDPPEAIAAFDQLRQAIRANPRHDAVMGHALMAALKEVLGTDFDDATREAWANGYVRLVETVMAKRRNRIDLVA